MINRFHCFGFLVGILGDDGREYLVNYLNHDLEVKEIPL